MPITTIATFFRIWAVLYLLWHHFRSDETGRAQEESVQPANLHKPRTEVLTRLFERNANNCHLGLSGCERGFTNSGQRGVESASIEDLMGVARFALLRLQRRKLFRWAVVGSESRAVTFSLGGLNFDEQNTQSAEMTATESARAASRSSILSDMNRQNRRTRMVQQPVKLVEDPPQRGIGIGLTWASGRSEMFQNFHM